MIVTGIPSERSDADQSCILPEPVDFSVTYDEGVSLTLRWRLHIPADADRPLCEGGDETSVQAVWYDSYDDFEADERGTAGRTNSGDGLDYRSTSDLNNTAYVLDITNLDGGSYFIFNFQNDGGLNPDGSRRRQETRSPIYHFGRQGLQVEEVCL